MSVYKPGQPALGDVGAYQVSGKPFFKGEIVTGKPAMTSTLVDDPVI